MTTSLIWAALGAALLYLHHRKVADYGKRLAAAKAAKEAAEAEKVAKEEAQYQRDLVDPYSHTVETAVVKAKHAKVDALLKQVEEGVSNGKSS
jgi:hypothetical protein